MPHDFKQMSEQEGGEGGSEEEILGAQGGGRGRAALPGRIACGCLSPIPRTMSKSVSAGGFARCPRLPRWQAPASPEHPKAPRRDGAMVPPVHLLSPRPGDSGPPHPAAGLWEQWPHTRWVIAREVLIYKQQNLLTPSLSGEGDMFSLACCRNGAALSWKPS